MWISPKLGISATFGSINLPVLLKMIDRYFFIYAPYFIVMMPLEELITCPCDCGHIYHKCQAMQCFFFKQSRSVAYRVVSPNISPGKTLPGFKVLHVSNIESCQRDLLQILTFQVLDSMSC